MEEMGRLSTIWIIPLVAMQEQLMLRCTMLRMTVAIWKYDMDLSNLPTNLIVVIETTESEHLRAFFRNMVDRRLFARIIVDEAHLILSHGHFRSVMGDLRWVGQLGIPVIIQSATIPPSVLPHLFDKLGVTQYRVCREPTSRPNISYRVERLTDTDDRLAGMVKDVKAGSGKMLIFCTSKDEVARLAHKHDIRSSTGEDTAEQVNAKLQELRKGTIRIIICTPVLGVALDVPAVDLVVHLGFPFSMTGYVQEAGRGGRGVGSMSTSVVLIGSKSEIHRPPTPDYMGVRLVRDHVLNRTRCRQFIPSLFNDGVGMTCTMMSSVANLCDVCQSNSELPASQVAKVEYSDDLILGYLVRQ